MDIDIKKITNYDAYSEAKLKHEAKLKNPYVKTKLETIYGLSGPSKSSVMKKILQEYLSDKKGMAVKWTAWRKYIYITLPNGKEYKGVVKSSFLWGDNGENGMRWQQIRTNEEYGIIIFVAIFPKGVKFRYASLEDFKIDDHRQIQHGKETSMIHGSLDDFEFMKTLDEL